MVLGLELEKTTAGDLASIKGGLPSFHIPLTPISFETLNMFFGSIVCPANCKGKIE